MLELSELEHDALTELFNIGMGLAASSLSQMVHEEIKLSVPHIKLTTRDMVVKLLAEETDNSISGIKQYFSGSFNGDALLLFPAHKSMELVRVLMGETLPLDALTEFEQEALSEVGNIILNACLGSLANSLHIEIAYQLPLFVQGGSDDLLDGSSDIILFLWVNFTLMEKDIKGYVVFLLGMDSITQLQQQIAILLREI